MSKPRGTPPPHIVIPDTNILWYKEKGPAVNPDFDVFWNGHVGQMKLTLIIPEIVFGELLFQQTTSASKAFDRASESFKELSTITSLQQAHHLTKEKIRSQVEAKLQRWIKLKYGSIAPVPVGTVDWKRVVQDAIWRRSPFSFDPKNPDYEKGFRDLMILETVANLVASHKGDHSFIFLSNDAELRNATVARIGPKPQFTALESLSAFSSYIKLTRENITQEFIKAILTRARQKFITSSDMNSLWFKEKLRERLNSEFKEKIETIEDTGAALLPLSGTRKWTPLNEGLWWIYSPDFSGLVGEREYKWTTRVLFVQQFYREPGANPPQTLLDLIDPPEKVHFVNFAIHWSSIIKADGRFQSMSVTSIVFASKEFRSPTDADIKDFKLEKKSSS